MTFTRFQKPSFWGFFPLHRRLRDEVDNLFSQAFTASFNSDGVGNEWLPAVDIYQTEDNLLVTAQLPGLKREDIAISLNDGVLSLSGERREETKPTAGKLQRTERVSGRFQREISLPCQVEAGQIKATYTDGVLTVSLPKSENAKPRQINVQ